MSEIIKQVMQRELCHIVECNDKYYYVDSAYLLYSTDESLKNRLGYQFETMVFKCDLFGNVKSWEDLYCERYCNASDMFNKHIEIINNLEKYI